MNSLSELPVVVIGAGPVGLAAAAQLLEHGLEPLILEAGNLVGANVREWGHVPLFSPWRYLTDRAALSLLEQEGWQRPDPEEHPKGRELVERYLEPLAGVPAIARSLRLSHRVLAVTRFGLDRMKTTGRGDSPFLVVAEGPGGEVRIEAQAVIDASGTWSTPNPLGAGGVAAQGEAELAQRIRYGIPEATGRERDRYAGRDVVVVGSGHSAQNAVLELAALRRETGSGQVFWAVRRQQAGALYGGGDGDQLPERAALGGRARALVDAGEVRLVTGFLAQRLAHEGERVRIAAADGRSLLVDELVVATGFRPRLEMLRELRIELDPITEAPVRLAPLIDPNVHSCGTVPPHGEAELAHPESGFYIVGMKSYGRAPTFLLLTGYEQVRSVVAFLAGDLEAARRVELELPETGVCSADGCCEPGAGLEGAACSIDWRSRQEELAVVGPAGSCC
ncbi:MAG TPA: NAD(P)-binding domain-containing protein [Trueperaceae bacterium]